MLMHKTSWFIFLLLLFHCLVPFSGQAKDSLKKIQTITVVSDDNYPPYIFRDSKGNIQGILVDEWALWEKKTGIKVNLKAMDWGKALELMLEDQADVIDTIFFNKKRAERYDFTKPYAKIEVPVFFHKNIGGIVNIASLQGLTIGVKAGDASIEVLKKNGITSLKEYSNYESIIQAAVDGQIKVFSIDKPPALYYLYKMNFENEFRHSLNLYSGEFHRAVKKGRIEILKTVEDGFESITKNEYEAINKKWMGEPLVRPVYFKYLLSFLFFISLIFLGLAVFNLTLRKKVRLKTAELEGALNQLKSSEKRYRLIAENMSDVITVMDMNLRSTYVSPSIQRLTGFTVEEAVEHSIEEIMTSDSLKKILGIIEEEMMVEASGTADPKRSRIIEYEQYRRDETIVWVEASCKFLRDRNQAPTGMLIISRDITERKKVEEEHRFLSAITANLSDSIIVTNARFEIIYINLQTEKLFGYSRNELKGKLPDFLNAEPTAEEIQKKIYETVSSGEIFYGESLNKKKDGSIFNCEYKIMPLPGKEGKPSAYVSLQRDITKRKQTEKEKFEAQQNAAEHEKYALVGQIAGKIAHDFNNILGAIMGNSELAMLDCSDVQMKKTLALIYNQTIRGKNLTKNLVAFAKDQEPKQAFFPIDEKIDLVLTLLKKDLAGINVIRQYGQRIPEILADPGMTEHALVNIIQNSIHATSLVEIPEIIIRSYHQNDRICLEIEDNGCGIPFEHLEKIFEPSFTLKGSRDISGAYKSGIRGTGYGMANVKRYVDAHKGKISIHSEIQKGTKIILSFPLIRKELTDEEIKKIQQEKICFEKYILVVEDEPAISDVQYRILTHEPCNHKVDIANNAQVAIDLLNRNTYDLISLDYMLPGKLNGMDLYHHIREKSLTIPILFISGNIEFLESIKELKQNDPHLDHLSKPCRNIDYVNSINKLLGN